MIKRLAFALLILVSILSLRAQDEYYVDVSTSKPEPAVGESFVIEYSLKFKGRNLNLQHSGIQVKKPNLSAFQIVDEYAGSSMDFGFGSSDITIQKYTFVLKPVKEGKQTISPLRFVMNGKEYVSGELNLTVKKGGQAAPTPQAPQASQGSGAPGPNQLFARMTVNKSSPYKGEGITITHKIYTTVDIASLGDVKFPSFSGFWSKEIPSTEVKLSNETVNGVNYRVVELRQHVLFAQQSGKLIIAPLEVECVISQIKERPPRDRMEQMFYGNVIRYRDNVKYSISSPTLSISVRDLPEQGRPAGFTGLVGTFKLEAGIDKDKVMTNDAVTLKYSVKGQGNIEMIAEPGFSFPPDFERYDPKESTNAKAAAGGVSGSKSFEFLLIPRKQGSYRIEPVEFSYFDPGQGRYIVESTPLFNIDVEKGDGNERQVSVSGTTQEDLQFIGQDIRFIRTGDLGLSKGMSFVLSNWFWALFLIPALFIAIVLTYKRQPNKPIARKAYQKARKDIGMAQKYLKAGQTEQFSEAMSQAMYRYAANQLGLSFAGLTVETIENTLRSKGIDESIIADLKSLIQECEFMRFAPRTTSETPLSTMESALRVIESIEKSLK